MEAAAVVGLVVLGLGVLVSEWWWRRAQAQRPSRRSAADLTNADPAIVPLLIRLDELDSRYERFIDWQDMRYRRFVVRVGGAGAVLALGLVLLAVLYGVQLDRVRDVAHSNSRLAVATQQAAAAATRAANVANGAVVGIQQARVGVLLRLCRDVKTLVSIIPPDFPLPRVTPNSALNRHRDCEAFTRHYLGPRPPPVEAPH